jgi:hypothetical protein
VLHRHLGGQGRYHLLRRIERDQRQVEKATAGDNRYLQVRPACFACCAGWWGDAVTRPADSLPLLVLHLARRRGGPCSEGQDPVGSG